LSTSQKTKYSGGGKPKRTRKKTRKSKKTKFWLKFGLNLFLTGTSLLAFFMFLIWIGVFGKIPSKKEISRIENNTASEVFTSDGKLMGRFFIENRLRTGKDGLSPNVINALVATEDARFFEHKGIDYISLGRVLVKTIIFRNKSQGGGSTISQQLSRNLYRRDGNHWWSLPVNKVKEAITANRIEKVYGKEQVLNLYLNTVPFGEEIYGIETAAQRFFSKSAKDLNPAEAATLIGMLAANTAYNPRLHPENSKKRRNIVLHRMESQGFLSHAETIKWFKTPINLKYKKIDHNTGIAPYFRNHLRIEVEKILKEEYSDTINLLTDGLRIYTSIDSRLQSYAEQSMRKHMARLQKEFNAHWKNRTPWKNNPAIFQNAVHNSRRYKALKSEGLDEKEIFSELKKKTSNLPGQTESKYKVSALDSVRQELLTLHTGFLAIDPSNGYILAWIGGINHKYFQYDHVKAKRQVGSTFKPIVYAAALKNGMEPCSFLANERKVYSDYNDWSPANDDNNYEGYYSLKGGMAHSVNTIAADVIMKTGIHRVISLAQDLGISSDFPEVPSIALGTVEISLLEMLQAYSAFLRYGSYVEPIGLIRIEDRNGKILYEPETFAEKENAFNKETSLEMIYMLKEVVDSGTARSLRTVFHLNGELAGKTGTTQNNADGWFIGFTPNILAGCWVGAENPSVHFRTTRLGQGAYMALPVFAGFIRKTSNDPALRKYTSGRFPILPVHLKHMLDCPDDSLENPELSFFEKLFGKNKEMDSLQLIRKKEHLLKREEEKLKRKEKNKNFMNKVRKFFRKKKK